MTDYFYPIGKAGECWGDEEKALWLSGADKKVRSYKEEVLTKIEKLKELFDVEQYGALSMDADRYPLFSVATRNWDASKPSVLVTGGVHGYEKSGVQGALQFCLSEMKKYNDKGFNIIACPCVSPWGYECIQRWSAKAVDPNRSFMSDVSECPAEESAAVVALVAKLKAEGKVDQWTMHIDMHETTDTDDSEFRPAKAARDGGIPPTSEIPDGFYLVADTESEQPGFQKAMIEGVSTVTHIAPNDADGNLIGEKSTQHGVVCIPSAQFNLCMGVTNATYRTTTEVYPDSKTKPVSEEVCIQAQVTCATSGLDFVLDNA